MSEHQSVEWKQSWRDEYLKWICGFAKAQGGTLVIGKNDRGEVTGVANAAKLLKDTFPKPPPANAGEVTGQVTGQVETWVLRVIEACSVNALKSTEIQDAVGIRHRETFQRNYLDSLLSDGGLERTIPDRPKSRLQKYRATDKARQLLENLLEGKAR